MKYVTLTIGISKIFSRDFFRQAIFSPYTLLQFSYRHYKLL